MKTEGPAPELSIIIPAYNEEARIVPSLDKITAYIDSRSFPAEILVVDDGSRDGTAKAVSAYGEDHPEVRLVQNGRNRGKGYTVRNGVEHSLGEAVLFSDADLSTPIEEYDKFRPLLLDGVDLVFASRQLSASNIEIRQPPLRQLMGKVFNLLVRAVAVPDVADSQCGFKAFSRRAARDLFRLQLVEGFAFDVELLFLAKKLGFSFKEVPVRWLDDPDSKVQRLWDPLRMFVDLVNIKSNELLGLYDRSVLAGKETP